MRKVTRTEGLRSDFKAMELNAQAVAERKKKRRKPKKK